MRLWFRLAMVVLIVLLGIRAWVVRPASDTAPPAGPGSPAVSPGETAAMVLTEALRNAGQRSAEGMAWRVTEANAAEGIMVIDVETERPGESRAIAEEIVDPLRETYQEILVYVRAPADAGDPVVRRVRWTPDEGYVEASFTER